jgi:hypothetical protein
MNGTALEGWFRVLAGGTAQSGSWDGFIGLNGVGYGPTLSGGTFSGYAWGDVNVGWVSFAQAQTTWSPCVTSYVCTDSTHRQDVCTGIITACTGVNICSTGVCVPPPAPSYTGVGSGKLKANPSVVRTNGTSQISWSVQDATSCTVTGNGNTWNATSSPVGGYTSSAITITTTYTLACSGAGGTLNDTVTIVVAPEWKEI